MSLARGHTGQQERDALLRPSSPEMSAVPPISSRDGIFPKPKANHLKMVYAFEKNCEQIFNSSYE